MIPRCLRVFFKYTKTSWHRLIDLFSLYVLFRQHSPCDYTLETVSFKLRLMQVDIFV